MTRFQTKDWVATAEELHDRLSTQAHLGKMRGFTGGAKFMAAALVDLGYDDAHVSRGMEGLGFRRYGFAVIAALAVAWTLGTAAAWLGASPWQIAVVAAPVFVVGFYAVESRFVYAFPLALLQCDTPMLTSHRLSGSIWVITPYVMRVAVHMLTGGFRGRGFIRSWCVGCLEIVLRFDRTRAYAGAHSLSGGQVIDVIPLLRFGSRRRLQVRHEWLECARIEGPVRILYASDLHLTARREHVVEQLLTVCGDCRGEHEPLDAAFPDAAFPDAILLGGDLVDRASGLRPLARLIRELSGSNGRREIPVLVVPGNHDRWVGVSKVRDVVLEAGGQWLVDESVELGGSVHVCGAVRQSGALREGASAVHVLCGHDPEVFPSASAAGMDVVLAGHLHGCQVVLWRGRERLYPGGFFYRFNGLRFDGRRFDGGRSTMFVSRGVADTLPVRFNCPREVVCLDLVPREKACPSSFS